MFYVYGATCRWSIDTWLCEFPAFPGTFSDGDTKPEAIQRGAEALRLAIASYLDEGLRIPESDVDDDSSIIVGVDVTDAFIAETRCCTVKQAAEALGVSSARVSQLLDSGGLEAYEIGGRRLVTLASVDAWERPKRGRPKREATTE